MEVLGGTSVLSYMVHSRGNKRDYDDWAAMGNDGWSYNDVLPFFKKFEDNREPEVRFDRILSNHMINI